MARLPQGTRKRKDGTLEKRFTINGIRYSVYAGNTKELAEKEQELREQLKQGTYTKNGNITLDKYFDEWLEVRRTTTKGNTLLTYTSYYNNHIKNKLGKRKIKDIERREVQELQRTISQNLSATACNNAIKVLKLILSDAVKDEIISRNPAKDIKALKVEKKATDTYHRALTEQEQADFMEELKTSYYYDFMAVMLSTGMRYGEVGALTWQDIDFKESVITVNKTLTHDEGGHLTVGETPKTAAGNRTIPITAGVRELLKNHKNKMEVLPFNTSTVFSTIYGNYIDNNALNDEIKRILRRLEQKGTKIELFTSHAFRDTFATRYIEQGGNMNTLKTILGHSSLKMTMDLYAHVLPDTKAEEMEKIKICI